jgi:O-antigen/teichoic acid export membrane protein
VVVLAAVFVAGLTGIASFAIAAAAGSFAWLLFVRPISGLIDPHLDGEAWRPVASRIVLLMAGAGLTASVITGYPAMVSLLAPAGDATQVGVLFATLQVSRVPLLLLSPLQALAVPTVVRLSGTAEGMHRLRRLLALGTLGTLVVGVVGAVVGLLIGPWLVKLLFGAKYASAEGWWVAGMVWGAVLLTALQLMTAVLVARTQANKVLVTWAVVAVSTALVLLFLPGDTILRAVAGLAAGPTVGLVVAAAFVLRRPGNVKVLPGV